MKTQWNERKLEKKKRGRNSVPLTEWTTWFQYNWVFFIHPIFSISLKSYFLCSHVASFLLFLTLHHPLFSPRFSRRWATPRVSTQTWTPWAQTRSRTAREKARRRHTRAITPHTPRTVQTHWRWAEKPGTDQFRVKSMFQVDVSAEGNLILSN